MSANHDYRAAVEVAKEYIRAGDAFQIVPSQRSPAVPATPLMSTGPADDQPQPLYVSAEHPRHPGMDTAGFSIVGSSPERWVKLTGDEAMLHPIAGTRPRGTTLDEDAALVADLLADLKERAEHLMLVDSGATTSAVCQSRHP